MELWEQELGFYEFGTKYTLLQPRVRVCTLWSQGGDELYHVSVARNGEEMVKTFRFPPNIQC